MSSDPNMQANLQPGLGMCWESGKTYTHAQGLSCTFRQWRADSHCNKLHGYALQVTATFRSKELDDRNWVQDFGGLKELKSRLESMFDHKTLVARDDPKINFMMGSDFCELADLVIVDHVGCEAFAKMIYDWIYEHISDKIFCVEVREHEGNFARYFYGH